MRAWFRSVGRARGAEMPVARSHDPVEPEQHLDELDRYPGLWVAVRDGHVVAAAETSSALVADLHRRAIRGAISRYVPRPSDSERVGVG